MEIESPAGILAVDDAVVRTVFGHYPYRLAVEIEVLVPGPGIDAVGY